MRLAFFSASAALLFVGAPASGAAPSAPIPTPSAAEKSAILRQLALTSDAKGLVENACGERVAPKFVGIDLGGTAGRAVVFVMEGGPNTAACYGDGPDLKVMRRMDKGFREIFAMQGGMMIVMPTKGSAARDIAAGGPGFSFPLWRWNGTTYVQTRLAISDKDIGDAAIYP